MPVKTFAIDNLGPYNVVAGSVCRRIVVQENFNSANPPTQDLQMWQPPGSGPINVPKGTPAVYSVAGGGAFTQGQIVGQINTVAGSITVSQTEGDLI